MKPNKNKYMYFMLLSLLNNLSKKLLSLNIFFLPFFLVTLSRVVLLVNKSSTKLSKFSCSSLDKLLYL